MICSLVSNMLYTAVMILFLCPSLCTNWSSATELRKLSEIGVLKLWMQQELQANRGIRGNCKS